MQNCRLFTARPQPCKNLVQHRLFVQSSLLRELDHSKIIPERICGDAKGKVEVFRLQNYNFTESNSIMIFFWEFSKLLESIIFRNIFTCVNKLDFIKNYIKTKRETKRGRRSSPHFVLKHLHYTRHRRSAKDEKFIKAFLKWNQDRLNWKFFYENKTILFPSFPFFLFIMRLP